MISVYLFLLYGQTSFSEDKGRIEQHIIGYQCKKTAVLSCHRYSINTAVEKMNNILI
jgi:hypothetical protein